MDDEGNEEDFSRTQLVVFDRAVENSIRERSHEENENQVESVNNVQLNDWSDDGFDDLDDEDYAALDRTIENCSENQQQNNEMNNNNNGADGGSSDNSHNNSNQEAQLTASQFDLASAILDDDANEPMLEHLECLQSKFHHSQFRDKQWEIIDMVMNKKRDVSAVMATGYGKSLCFQFPAVFKNGMVLVISPLIALMEAQVMALEKLNVKACLVGSAQPDKQICARIQRGEFNIIYSSPEFLHDRYGQGKRMLNSLVGRLMLIAIDESHCVSGWGHEFRPYYRQLNIVRDTLPNTPILALTATATARVRNDIKTSLGLQDPYEIVTSFDRPNLEFIVHEKSGNVWSDLRPWVTNLTGSVIVYVLKREEAKETADILKMHGVECAWYHAGINDRDRKKEIVKNFVDGEVKVIVATTAFGMGIDRRDIRAVVHYGGSKNLESYYQEVGRAGRDDLHSKVVTYFSPDDFDTHDYFLDKDEKDKQLSIFVKKYLRDMSMYIRKFLHSPKCRRKMILEYFGESTNLLTVRSDCCDNCAKGLSTWRLKDLYHYISNSGHYNFETDARILLRTIEELEKKNIPPERERIVQKLQDGANRREPYYWNALIDQLTYNDYIKLVAGKTQLTLAVKARMWLTKRDRLWQEPVGATYRFLRPRSGTPLWGTRWSRNYRNGTSNSYTIYEGHSCVELFFGQCQHCG